MRRNFKIKQYYFENKTIIVMNKNPRRKMFFILQIFQVSNTNAAWTLTNMQATLFILYLSLVTLAAKKPNIVLVLTDDQDVVLGSVVSLLTQNILFNSFISYFNKNQRYKYFFNNSRSSHYKLILVLDFVHK